jgi:hypothetical protein
MQPVSASKRLTDGVRRRRWTRLRCRAADLLTPALQPPPPALPLCRHPAVSGTDRPTNLPLTAPLARGPLTYLPSS